jgi:hypothetical protein
VLIRDYIVLIFRIQRLVVGWHVDFIVGELVFAEVFEEVCIAATREMDVGVVGVFGLWGLA